MTDNILKASTNPVKFSPLEMQDRFLDGDHTYKEFDYTSPLRTEDTDGADDAASGGVDPHAHGLGGDLKSAVVGIVKGMVGPAILYLPHGFAQAGWVIAVPMLFASTALYLASSSSLLECWEIESRINKRLLQQECNGDHIREENHTELEMRDLRQSNDTVGGNDAAEELENQFFDGAVADGKGGNSDHNGHSRRPIVAAKPSYPDLAKKAFGSKGQTIVKIGIAASKFVCLVFLNLFLNLISILAMLFVWFDQQCDSL